MAWQIIWSLILGFTLSAVVQAVVRRETIIRLLGDDRPRTLALAAGLGVASSSCSYAAVALARPLFRKGANFTAAMAFEIACTNLVVELGDHPGAAHGLAVHPGRVHRRPDDDRASGARFPAPPPQRLIQAARDQADKALSGSMEGHAAMDMAIAADGSLWRGCSSRAVTVVSHIFVMEWAAVLRDIVLGLLIAGAVGAWVPDSFWRHLFLTGHPLAAKLWGR